MPAGLAVLDYGRLWIDPERAVFEETRRQAEEERLDEELGPRGLALAAALREWILARSDQDQSFLG